MKATTMTMGIVDLNLLPETQRPADVPPIALAFAMAMTLALLSLIPLALNAQHARAGADTVQAQVDMAERSLKGLQLNLARQRAARSQLEQSKAQLSAVQHARESLQGGKRALDSALALLTSPATLPPGARITTITGVDKGFEVNGTAPGPLDAIAYAGKLVSSGAFPLARMSAFAPGTKDSGQFTIQVTR